VLLHELEVHQAELAVQNAELQVANDTLRDTNEALLLALACDALGGPLPDDEHRKCLAAIVRSTARCERLIKDLLGVAHLEAGRLTLELAPLVVGALVRQVCRDLEPAVVAAGSTLAVAIAEPPVEIRGDRDRLHQVLSNLIGNAIVHARGAAIEVSVASRGAEVLISVADDGPGILAEELPFVFERYRQGRRHRGGAGLGLAIVKGLVEAHGGTTTVTSQPGHGARFEIALPRHVGRLP
jgi:signal transduction histidine kinase